MLDARPSLRPQHRQVPLPRPVQLTQKAEQD
jgi:hypothetical protein